MQPYVDDPVDPEMTKLFATAAEGQPAVSWAGMSLEADPRTASSTAWRRWRGRSRRSSSRDSGIETVWKKNQTTTEWATLIGPKQHRVWVGTDIPGAEIPGKNKTDRIMFRDAATGRLLARSARVPVMTQGSAVQPGYGGSVFFPGATGTLIKVTPSPK